MSWVVQPKGKGFIFAAYETSLMCSLSVLYAMSARRSNLKKKAACADFWRPPAELAALFVECSSIDIKQCFSMFWKCFSKWLKRLFCHMSAFFAHYLYYSGSQKWVRGSSGFTKAFRGSAKPSFITEATDFPHTVCIVQNFNYFVANFLRNWQSVPWFLHDSTKSHAIVGLYHAIWGILHSLAEWILCRHDARLCYRNIAQAGDDHRSLTTMTVRHVALGTWNPEMGPHATEVQHVVSMRRSHALANDTAW